MPSCIFDTCCGCIELRTGCLIIGYLNLIGEMILIALSLVGLISGSAVVDDQDAMVHRAGVGIMAVSVILLIVALFCFIFTIVYLVGVHQSKRGHVKVFLIVFTILLMLSAILTFINIAQYSDWRSYACSFVQYLVNIYFMLVIRSHYYKMDDKRPAIYNTA